MPSSRKSKFSSAAKQLAQSKASKSGISPNNPASYWSGKIVGNDEVGSWNVPANTNAKGFVANRRATPKRKLQDLESKAPRRMYKFK